MISFSISRFGIKLDVEANFPVIALAVAAIALAVYLAIV